ncbi:unnamed protein product [Rotaria sp. Silwood2]|nr:unnamed protein product [Rotaria sp. Silwood2]CAF3114757.1 unnamed protein product [Rotaria sp. Silwood2]CAF3896148.1 unnamed protein product [Rotaria sp. Silwood2]CAF4043101.1 unnamed protein product [Rotaria sp. Silwood2]
MMFILFIFLLIHKSQSLEWNCTATKHYLFSNDQIYEQCTIIIEYISLEQQQQKQKCITHSLSIKALPPISILSNYTMHTFKIHSCQLLTLNQLPFSLPSSVENLDLSYNLLSTFTLSFPLPLYLKYLRLDHNPNLIDINFGYNHIQERLIGLSLRHNKHIQLKSLPLYLQQLDLTNCNLFESSILSILKTLTKLTHLSLADNQLKQLPLLDKRIQLEYLNLSNNHLTFIDNGWLHKSLKILDLKFNQIESLEFFNELLKINQALKQNNHNQTMINNTLQLSLHGNPIICDCWFGSILNSSFINITDLSLLQCNSHSIMNMSQDNFLCSYSQYCASDCSCCDFEACDCHSVCPSECLCLHDSSWLNHIVQCQQRNLFDIHIHLPETVTELNYEENNIEQLQPFVFVGKNLLIKLNLAKNNIKNLTNDIFCGASNLHEINLSYNRNLMIKLSNINELFSCLKYLEYIILSKEQIYKDEQINIGWMIKSNNNLIRLIRIKQQLSLSTHNLYTASISTSIYPLIQSETQSTTIFPIYHQQSLISSSFIQHNQTLIIIVFFLLLFLLLFLLFLILLAICRRKLRHHLRAELQRQRSHHYYYHTNLHQSSIQIPNSNGTIGVNDSLYEQLPSLSSDSEQPFLCNEKKLTNTNAPALPPYPPTFRRYHCCHSINSHEYQYGRNNSTTTATAAFYSSLNLQQHPCPTVLVVRNPSLYANHHEYSCELQQCLVSNQQEKHSMICCNNETGFIPTILCQCNDPIQNIDTCTYPNVHK